MGFAQSRAEARQMICHGHIAVNSKKVSIASYQVQEGTVISHYSKDSSKRMISENLEFTRMREKPTWVNINAESLQGKVVSLPSRDDVSVEVDEQLIIEFCSR